MAAETKTHDAWFQSKVHDALSDQRAATPHAEAMQQVQALIDDKRREKS